MKKPRQPPRLADLLERLQDAGAMNHVLSLVTESRADREYLPWDRLRFKPPPAGMTSEEWWAAVKIMRYGMLRGLPLADINGQPFRYALPDKVLRSIELVNRALSGRIGVSEQVTNPATKEQYVVNSLIEEAITSSQLEGASTSRLVAKEMLRSGRPAKSRDERMIVNNYHAMIRIGELRQEALTPQLICEVQEILTEGTLDNPDAAGRFQYPDETRVAVFDTYQDLLHMPPPAAELPRRIDELCTFVNEPGTDIYVPPGIRAIILHFMIGYIHPFEDGNGRTARALFYWSMLHDDYWLTEFISISRILKKAPVKYAKSYLYSEQDESDLTYFVIYQLGVLERAIEELHTYLARKAEEVSDFQRLLAALNRDFNHRQVAILQHALKNPGATFTAESHGRSHNISRETARTDLVELADRGLLQRIRLGRANAFRPAADVEKQLQG